MKLACNFSNELIELMDEKKVQVDYIKIGLFDVFKDYFEIIKGFGPTLLHGMGLNESTTMDNLDQIDWEQINSKIYEFKTPALGIHLSALKSTVGDMNEEEITLKMLEVINLWKKNINVPFLIENVHYTEYYGSRGQIELCTKPEFINDICRKTDVKMILDIAHAKIAANYRKESLYDYIEKIGVDNIQELHVVGIYRDIETGFRDKHLEMEEEDYEVVQWLIQVGKNINMITLEYGGIGNEFAHRSDKRAIERQLKRLSKLI